MLGPVTIDFEFTDDKAAQAARENWIALGRRSFSPRSLAIIAASTAIFGVALRSRTSLAWRLIAGTAPALILVLLIIWVIGLWWVPRAAQKRLERLEHRNVTIVGGDDELTIKTANERLAVKWIELRELRELPHYLVLVLASNAEIPMPREAVSPDAKAFLEGKLAMQPPEEPLEKPVEKKPEATSEEAVEEAVKQAPEATAEKTPEKAPEATPEETLQKAPEVPSEKTPEETPEKTPEK